MASGNFSVSSDNSSVIATCNWSSFPNTEGNYSTVYVELRASRNNTGSTTSGSGTCTINIDSKDYNITISPSQTITYNSNTLLGSASVTIWHNSDGNRSVNISARANINAPLTLGPSNRTVTLDSIPKVSNVSLSSSSCTMRDGSITIYTNRASTSFSHIAYYSFYNTGWVKIASGVGDSVTWYPDISLASQIPSQPNGSGTILLETYDSCGNYIGRSTANYTLNIPSNLNPSASICLIGNNKLSGSYVQDKSTITVNTGFTGIYGSLASSYECVVTNSQYSYAEIYTGSSITASLPYPGSYTVQVRVKDSRGQYSSYESNTLSVIAYTDPNFSSFSAYRSDSAGIASETGTFLHWSGVASLSPINNGTTNLNVKTYKLQYKKTTDASWTTVDYSNTYSYSMNGSVNVSGLGTDATYDVQFIVQDSYKVLTKVATIPHVFSLIDFYQDGKGIAIGKIAENTNQFDVNLPARLRSTLQMDGEITSDGTNQKYARALKSISGYPGFTQNDGTDTGWIRTPSYGILPYTSGGSGSCGTSTWPFSGIYGTNIYQNGYSVWSTNTLPVSSGNWAPSGSNLSLSTSTSRYRRVGNLVTISYTGYITPNGSTNQAGIAGLPYTPAAYASSAVGYSRLTYFIGSSCTTYTAITIGADTDGYIRFYGVTGGRTWALGANELSKNGSDGWVCFSLTYEI